MTKEGREFDIVIFGASGYTGKLVVEYFLANYANTYSWAVAGRNTDKLRSVLSELSAPQDTPVLEVDSTNDQQLTDMARRTRCVITTVGPYQLYGSQLVATCSVTGTDYVDLTGEPGWMHDMISAHESAAQASGARIVFSCGFDSIPFDLGVQYVQELATEQTGGASSRVKCRVEAMNGEFSGGTAASLGATMQAIAKRPALAQILGDPFALVVGSVGAKRGPDQPDDSKVQEDDAIGAWVMPFIMAPINTKNVHRSNALLGYPYGQDFRYDEMAIVGPGEEGKKAAEALAQINPLAGDNVPQPGEGPSKEAREAGNYSCLFIASGEAGQDVRARVTGDMDPGYGSTSKMLVESGLCLVKDIPEGAGGMFTPASALGKVLRERLTAHAGLTFEKAS